MILSLEVDVGNRRKILELELEVVDDDDVDVVVINGG